jgi:hypothetical protein
VRPGGLVGAVVLAATAAIVPVAGALAPAVQPRTLTLNWVEKTSPYGYPPMTFSVESVTVDGSRWTVRASVVNRSGSAVKVTRGDRETSAYRFGLLVPSPNPCHPSTFGGCWHDPPVLLGAQSTRPQVPSTLKPGARWTGTISGFGKLPNKERINVTFGYFVTAAKPEGFAFVTDHTFRL